MSEVQADLALPDVPDLEAAADPATYIVQACERAKTWLAEALEHGDIDQIVELKSQAEAIRVYTMAKQLGKDAQLSATEIVRRSERGIGLAIRKGQDAGEFYKRGDGPPVTRPYERFRHGRTETVNPGPQADALDENKRLTGDYFNGGQDQTDTYMLADDLSDEEFDGILAEARAEGNLSRANVVRRTRAHKDSRTTEWIPENADRSPGAVKRRRELIRAMAGEGHTSRQISDRLGIRDDHVRTLAREMGVDIHAEKFVARTRRVDSSRIVRETMHALDGLAMGVGLVELDELDPAETQDWAASIATSLRTLNRFSKQLKEKTQ